MTVLLHALTHSDLTQRVGLTLAHALWQGLLVALALAAILRAMRTASAAFRHAAACAALLGMLACPAVTFLQLGDRLPPVVYVADHHAILPALSPAPAIAPAAPPDVTRDQRTPGRGEGTLGYPVQEAISWQAWIVGAWLLGITMLTLWHGMGWMSLQRLRRRGVTSWSGEFDSLTRRVAQRLGLRMPPRVMWSTRIGGPVAFGCWRAVVLMPASMATGFSMAQIEMILAHEFAHLKRHDYLINLCQTAASTLLFFHPAVWWINRVIRREREHACDDLAVAAVGDAAGYARALATLAEQSLAASPALAPAAASGRGALRRRIERLLRPAPSRAALRFWPGVAMLALALFAWQTLPTQPPAAQAAPARATGVPLRGDIRDRNGVVLAFTDAENSRRYPFAAMAAHVLGYVNATGEKNLDDMAGAYGVERSLDERLTPSASREANPSRRGADVYLTIDARHQTVVEQSLRNSNPKLRRAAAVLLLVDSGDVLAMASVPSFDPNDFIPSISREKFEELNADKTHPMLNRGVRAFVPGSTFKVATSLAAICSHHEGDIFTCAGGVTYGNRRMSCWIGQKGGAHGAMSLRQAVAASCGPYFFQLGNAVGNDAMEETISLCGFGRRTGIELDEEAGGILPLRTWWTANRPREPFTEATVANISIGQGAVEATPLQLASLMATVANGGTVWRPRLVDRIAPAGDAPKAEMQPRVRTADLREHGLTDSGLAALRRALEDVVHAPEGTAHAAQSPVIRIAGKTGTAQNWRMENGQAVRDNHTWFVCYAPAEKPKWALAVLVQGGTGGDASAAPIARHILEQVSAIEAGTLKVEPKPMASVKGSFDTVNQVKLPPWRAPE